MWQQQSRTQELSHNTTKAYATINYEKVVRIYHGKFFAIYHGAMGYLWHNFVARKYYFIFRYSIIKTITLGLIQISPILCIKLYTFLCNVHLEFLSFVYLNLTINQSVYKMTLISLLKKCSWIFSCFRIQHSPINQ